MACPACHSDTTADARFCSVCGARLLPTIEVKTAPLDRRQLTSLFCDIVDSTKIGELLDTEDLRELLVAYRTLCGGIVREYHGEMARYLGDGIVAHIGLPIAREDMARLAVQAALKICESMPALSQDMQARHGLNLAVRIGIDTGVVVTGSHIGLRGLDASELVGRTLNNACRLQELAPPNGVVIGQFTLRLVQGQFIVKSLGAKRLRGVSREVLAYQVIESSSAQSLFEAKAATGLSPLVGRDEQLGQLLRKWEQVGHGRLSAVLVCGEPGIGKSRLIHELQGRVAADSAVQITCQCDAQHQNSAFYPLAVQLARVFGVYPGDRWPDVVAKVQEAVGRFGLVDPQIGERLALVLAHSFAGASTSQLSTIAGADDRRRASQAVAAYVSAVTARIPLLLIVEDLHWADPSTLELLTHLSDHLQAAPAMILMSAREEASAAISVQTRINLKRVSHEDSRALVEGLSGSMRLPTSLVSKLVARSDGVPLFLEELTKTVLEDFDQGQQAQAHREDAAQVPATLQDSLMARLDRLGNAKTIAQVAAAIGRRFGFEILMATVETTEADLGAGLDRLVEAGLILRLSRGVESGRFEFEFKHELVRVVAYESLVRPARRIIHERIAGLLQDRFVQEAGRYPELVAHHYTEAGIVAAAIPLWELAGQRAIRNSANLEAVAHLSRALALVETLPASGEKLEKELELDLALAAPLMAAKGYGAPELDLHLSRAMVRSEETGNAADLVPLIYGRWSFQQVTGQLTQSLIFAEQFVKLAECRPEPEPRIMAYRLLGTSLQAIGRPVEAIDWLERSVRLFDPDRDSRLAYLYGADVKVMALCSLALARWVLGQQRSAERDMDEAWSRAERLGHGNTLAYCASYCMTLWVLVQRLDGYAEFLDGHRRLLELERPPVWLATLGSYEGWLLSRNGQPESAIKLYQACLEAMQAIKLVYFQATAHMWLGEALGLVGNPEDAEAAFQRGHEIMTRTGERWAEAELLRLWGCMRADAGREGSLELFAASLAVAGTQGASGSALRTWTDIVRRPGLAWPGTHRLCEAIQGLAEPYGHDYDAARQLILFDECNKMSA